MSGLLISFYFWNAFSKNNEKAIIEIIQSRPLANYKNYEIYVILISVAIFGLAYDYTPKSLEYSLYFPTGFLMIFSGIMFFLNGFIHKSIFLYFKIDSDAKSIETEDRYNSLIFEENPYQTIIQLEDDFHQLNYENQKRLLLTLQRLSAIDLIESLEAIITNTSSDDKIFKVLSDVHFYLKNLRRKIELVENPFEFIEQSNDLSIIKGIIRNQITKDDKNLIIKLLNDSRIAIVKPACIVAGYYDDINIISILIEHLEKPNLTHWAQMALKKIGEKSIKYLEIEYFKRKDNLLFVDSCFNLICQIENHSNYNLLFSALNDNDSNVRKIAAKKIVEYDIPITENHRRYFKRLFDDLVLSILSNDYLINQLQLQNEKFKTLRNAIENENKEAIYLIINIVKLYYHGEVVEKIFNGYKSHDKSLHAATNLLIDIMFEDNISVRDKLKTIFSPYERVLLEALQDEFPGINLKPKFEAEEELIWHILKKEYDQINSWTRACALNILHYTYKEDIPFELAAEFLNKNRLLKEVAAVNIYNNLPEFYTIFLDRLVDDESKRIDYLIRSNLDIANPKQINADNLMLEDKIKFLISIPYLNSLSISEIINFHTYFKVSVLKAGEHKISLQKESNLGYWIIETGTISYSKNGIDFYEYNKRDIIRLSDHETLADNVFFYCEEDTRFLIIEEVTLMNIIQGYNEIIQKYINILPDKDKSKNIKELNQNAA
ncbi:hypothetical protein [Marivirga arenosa]|uniref:Cyclic nucleotide-binding domain-containing protein n=1 Tax=Marivirga arenosa TaxID=3059076 RepID=A0AA51ZXZ1_9BACT|nr:hypothetical protein [Marivirga sp. BKB1-2]WNB18840.1 hypothetical protein QYS47_31540 [Marivirga sp. BKB1-2]